MSERSEIQSLIDDAQSGIDDAQSAISEASRRLDKLESEMTIKEICLDPRKFPTTADYHAHLREALIRIQEELGAV